MKNVDIAKHINSPNMKNRIYTLLLLVSIIGVLSSCKKDEVDPTIALIGTWQYYSEGIINCDNPNINRPFIPFNCTGDSCTYLIFKDNCKIETAGKYPSEGGWKIIDGKISWCDLECTYCETDPEKIIEYSITGNVLTFSFKIPLYNNCLSQQKYIKIN